MNHITFKHYISASKHYRDIYRRVQKQIKNTGLSPAEWALLSQIKEYGELRNPEAAKILGIANTTVSLLITQLERSGLVNVRIMSDDQRMRYTELTDKGKKTLEGKSDVMLQQGDKRWPT